MGNQNLHCHFKYPLDPIGKTGKCPLCCKRFADTICCKIKLTCTKKFLKKNLVHERKRMLVNVWKKTWRNLVSPNRHKLRLGDVSFSIWLFIVLSLFFRTLFVVIYGYSERYLFLKVFSFLFTSRRSTVIMVESITICWETSKWN